MFLFFVLSEQNTRDLMLLPRFNRRIHQPTVLLQFAKIDFENCKLFALVAHLLENPKIQIANCSTQFSNEIKMFIYGAKQFFLLKIGTCKKSSFK